MEKSIEEAMSLVKMPFGQYQGWTLGAILAAAPAYLQRIATDCGDLEIKSAASIVLKSTNAPKIESIVREALMRRGFSRTEADIFIKQLKNSKQSIK